jgi:hypothetical protein
MRLNTNRSAGGGAALGTLILLPLTLVASAPAIADRADLLGFNVQNGQLIAGDAASLAESDDIHVRTSSGFGDTFVDLHNMRINLRFRNVNPVPDVLNLQIESAISAPAGRAQVSLFNWDTGQFDLVDQYAIGMDEEARLVGGLAAAPYIGDDDLIEVSIRHLVFVPIFAYRFESRFDLARIDVAADSFEIPFLLPYDGQDHVVVPDLTQFDDTAFVFDVRPWMPIEFDMIAIGPDGEELPGGQTRIEPGVTTLFNHPDAVMYVARMPLLDENLFAEGVALNQAAITEQESDWSDRACGSAWLPISLSHAKGTHSATIRAYSSASGERRDSECPLKGRWRVLKKRGNDTVEVRASAEIDIATGTSTTLSDELTQADRDAGAWIVFEVKCTGETRAQCRISVKTSIAS